MIRFEVELLLLRARYEDFDHILSLFHGYLSMVRKMDDRELLRWMYAQLWKLTRGRDTVSR